MMMTTRWKPRCGIVVGPLRSCSRHRQKTSLVGSRLDKRLTSLPSLDERTGPARSLFWWTALFWSWAGTSYQYEIISAWVLYIYIFFSSSSSRLLHTFVAIRQAFAMIKNPARELGLLIETKDPSAMNFRPSIMVFGHLFFFQSWWWRPLIADQKATRNQKNDCTRSIWPWIIIIKRWYDRIIKNS